MKGSPRETLRNLLDEPTGAAALARAGRMLQAWRAGGLAAAELEDGWLLDERLAHTPPTDPDSILRGLASRGEVMLSRRRLRSRTGTLIAAPSPAGGWMLRWEGSGRAWVGDAEVSADRWVAVAVLPTQIRTPVGTENLVER